MNPTLANKPVMLVFTKRDLINTESEKLIDSYFEIPDVRSEQKSLFSY
jgi:hypothetical protein